MKKIIINLICGFIPSRKLRHKFRNLFNKKEVVIKTFIGNVFNTNYDKSVLISYITNPFLLQINKSHTNLMECYTAAEIFSELGYNVDVIEYTDEKTVLDFNKYSVCFGFGKSFKKMISYKNTKSIFYGTGTSTLYSNKVTLKKVKEFYEKTGNFLIDSARYADSEDYFDLYFSDSIIALGNEFTKKTYELDGGCKNIKNIESFYYETNNINAVKKDFSKCRKNFLWFGSWGLLHKGLDTVLDVFKERTDINLYICGAHKEETGFCEYYYDAMENKIENIKNIGFVGIDSEEFKTIMETCVSVVFPSVSEGGAPSVLTVMGNGGLIPIISKASGLDINKYGFEFDSIDKDTLGKNIDKLLSYTDDELKNLSVQIQNETRERYTYKNYKNNLKKLIIDSI